MENETPILIDHVTRSYDGTPVVRDLNLAVKPGSIYGFLGRNGAGKTTTLRMLAGLIKPHVGDVRVLGTDPFTMGAAERQLLGYMSEKAIIPAYTKVRSVLRRAGIFAFSTEAAESFAHYAHAPNRGYLAGIRGRFAHTLEYLSELAERHDFQVEALKQTPIRTDAGRPVLGWLAIWRAGGGDRRGDF